MALPKNPDAVIFPHGRMQNLSLSQRLKAIDKILAPVFGCLHCQTAVQSTFNFTTPFLLRDGDGKKRAPGITLLFPSGHPLEKRERLTWYVAVQDRTTKQWSVDESKPLRSYLSEPDAIKFGYLKADPLAEGEDETLEFNPGDFNAPAPTIPDPAPVQAAEPVAEPPPVIAAKLDLPPL
jgi:hypothetical protein